jgi:hypothetical protein
VTFDSGDFGRVRGEIGKLSLPLHIGRGQPLIFFSR